MRKKYCIGLAVFSILLICVIMTANYSKKNYIEKTEHAEKSDSVITQGNIDTEEIFYLAELNDYLVVYCSDKKTIYEYTNILVNDLPSEIQDEIVEWKEMKGLHKVYGFLENYSS